jgi:hypothetical protein
MGNFRGIRKRLRGAEALRVATNNNAYMIFEEDAKGSIETGKLADFLILDKDILTVPEDEIGSILPLATNAAGGKSFRARAEAISLADIPEKWATPSRLAPRSAACSAFKSKCEKLARSVTFSPHPLR